MYTFLYEQNKRSKYESFLKICKRDFDDYTEKFLLHNVKYNEFKKSISSIKEFNQKDNITELHKKTLSEIRNLIKIGEEKVAFSLFFSTFPTCLPNRNLNKLF